MTAPFAPAGTNVPSRIVFNSGTIDFGGNRLVQVDNLSLSVEWTTAPLYVLGYIKPQDLVRHSQKTMLTGKIKSFSPEADSIAYGVSTSGTPNEIQTIEGQPTYTNPVVTLFDRNGKEIQYQFLSALFKSSKANLKSEDYAEFDFELESIDVYELYTS